MALSHSPSIVTDGLVLCLDAANLKSYPGSGTTWFDISGNKNHFTLENGPIFSGSNRFVFDGINDLARSINTLSFNTNNITVQFLFKPTSYSASFNQIFFEHSSNWNGNANTFIHSYGGAAGSDQIIAGTKGPGFSYNYSTFDKSLYNDLNWKFSNVILDRRVTGTTRETYFYTQATERSEIATPLSTDNSENFGTYTFYIGQRAGIQNPTAMELSYFSIYSRVLNRSEITQNFNAFRGRFNL